MSEHTPTPWRVYTNKDGTKLVGIGALDGGGILDAGFGVWSWNDPEGVANAHMVVKAVNAHERLVETLQEARLQIEYLHGRFEPTGTSETVLARINHLLTDLISTPNT